MIFAAKKLIELGAKNTLFIHLTLVPYISAVGEINVVNKMNEVNANLGGEGNGGVILRECHLGRDSLVGVTMVLNRMSQSSDPLSVIHQSMPQFVIVKDKVNIKGINSFIK